MYAVIDIETTGGKYNEEGITEIAIYKHDGLKVIDQFISLVNPERDIQPFVVNLTGINKKMLRNAPKFYEIAKRIIEITQDCIIVAHNVKFDYRILRTEFSRLGYDYQNLTLCTVELAKELIPDQPSYSLGKLARALGIPVSGRHRASGDALATVKLFKLLLNKDTEKQIVKKFISNLEAPLKKNLKQILDELPSLTGVYYIHNVNSKIIYIGYSRNIKKTINKHFVGSNTKALKIQQQVYKITFELTGNELIAILKEIEGVQHHRPALNNNINHNKELFALYKFKDKQGFSNLTIDKHKEGSKAITTFSNLQSARSFILKIIDTFNLCPKLCGLDDAPSYCINYTSEVCHGACINQEEPVSYNLRVQQFFEHYNYSKQTLIIIDKGRSTEERSVVYIEDGVFMGLGFFDLEYQINNKEVLESIITPMTNSNTAKHHIHKHLRNRKPLKVITP